MSLSDIVEFVYKVRISNRAKRVNLSIKPGAGLEVIIPKNFDSSQIEGILQKNRQWIDRNLLKYSKQNIPDPVLPPTQLRLLAIDRTLNICYQPELEAGRIILKPQGDNVRIQADMRYEKQVSKLLCEYLKQIAYNEFSPLLRSLAIDAGIAINRVTIRGQRTRWGSCSSQRNISLNFKLLFLPPELARYVLLHELAHTRYLNHSVQYWRYLITLSPNARELDRDLRQGGLLVPAWLDGGIG